MNRVLLIVAAFGLFFGCKKTPAELNVTAQPMTFNQIGAPVTGTGTIEIASNAAWTIATANDWVHVDKMSGAGNETVTVTLDAGSLNTRNSTITIQADDLVETVSITQLFDAYAEMDDEGFREYCRNATDEWGVLPFDINGDGIISPEEAENVRWIEVEGMGISSLKGIECFTELEILRCADNAIKSLDLSHNTKLALLNCHNNQLETLNITGCAALASISCANNKLTALDISTNTALRELSCRDNEIATLDASKCTLLELLSYGVNTLSTKVFTLDISGCRQLKDLSINGQDTDVYVWPEFDTTTPSNSVPKISYPGLRTTWIKR